MKIRFHLIILCLFISSATYAQQGKFEVIGYSINTDAPLPFLTKKKSGAMLYDSRVIGSPKFAPGYIITLTGEKLKGNIAVFNNTSDWSFVKRALLIIPEGEEQAQYLGSGIAAVIFQKGKKRETYYDYYDGIFLERLVTGKLQLSYNPAANTSRKVSSFVSQSFMDSVRSKTVKKSLKEDLADGKTLKESLDKAKLKSDVIDAFSEIEVVDKEYLLLDRSTNSTVLINKSNYTTLLPKYLQNCSSFGQDKINKYLKNYSKLVDLVKNYNESCQ